MKLFALFAMMMLGFLTVEPLSFYFEEEESSCCISTGCSKEMPEEEEEESSCDMNVCNPFMSCLYGNFFINTSKHLYGLDFSLLKNKFISYNEESPVHQPRDCFRPPETGLLL